MRDGKLIHRQHLAAADGSLPVVAFTRVPPAAGRAGGVYWAVEGGGAAGGPFDSLGLARGDAAATLAVPPPAVPAADGLTGTGNPGTIAPPPPVALWVRVPVECDRGGGPSGTGAGGGGGGAVMSERHLADYPDAEAAAEAARLHALAGNLGDGDYVLRARLPPPGPDAADAPPAGRVLTRLAVRGGVAGEADRPPPLAREACDVCDGAAVLIPCCRCGKRRCGRCFIERLCCHAKPQVIHEPDFPPIPGLEFFGLE